MISLFDENLQKKADRNEISAIIEFSGICLYRWWLAVSKLWSFSSLL